MLKIGAGLLLGLFLVPLGDTAMGAYVIRLKNGNEFVTGRYWEEGRQVLFDTYGGVFGIDRSLVAKILQSDKPILLLPIREHAPEEKPKLDAATEKTEKKEADKPSAPEEAKSVEKSADDPIQKEFNTLKAQSAELSTMLTGELDEHLKKVVALMSRIQSDRKINQYLREYSELNAMANAAEAALKSRR
jgi:hypothetical protein